MVDLISIAWEGGKVPPGGSEHVTDLSGVWGGIVLIEDFLYDLFIGSLTEDTLYSDLFCPLMRTIAQERIVEQIGVSAIHEILDLTDLSVEIGGDLPLLIDLDGVGEGVSHGVSVVDLISIRGGVGALLPPLCHLSDRRSLLDLCLLHLTVRPCCLAPLAALGLGAMHQESKRTLFEAGAILRIYLETCSDCIILTHEHFTIAREETFVDQVIELPTIGCCEIEILRQFQTHEQGQVLRIAIELEIRIVHCYHHPRLQIGSIEEITRLMNANQFGVLLACFLQRFVDKISTIPFPESFNNLLEVVCSILIHTIVLYLGRSSEATELGVLTITNRTLAVLISNSERQTEESTWAGLACRQVENHGVFVEFGVTVREVKHGASVVLT